ncbi:MAG: iron-containing alcohol dehydrogenase [Lachnospiraceae bacterium]|nr:hypothetical protein C819_03331 [Lachnospiraceae bacterium 10-1]MCX4351334.1 iron-containing alcohol dehydrogenase [Lachnospiraceae bacterium]
MNEVLTFSFGNTQVLSGMYASKHVAERLANKNRKKVLVVTDKGLSGIESVQEFLKSLQEAGLEMVLYAGVTANPKDYEVMEGAGLYKEKCCDVVVGVGGGSSLDTAKCISAMVRHEGDIMDYGRSTPNRKYFTNGREMLVLIPTTSGTGSEISPHAVITNTKLGRKSDVQESLFYCDLIVLDAVFTLTMPEEITKDTGIDALTHLIDSYMNKKMLFSRSPFHDAVALEGIRLVSENLRAAVQKGEGNEKARENMMWAAMMGGFVLALDACSIHGLAGMLQKYRPEMTHGQSVGIMMPACMRHNIPAFPERFQKIAEAMGVNTKGMNAEEAAEAGIMEIEKLLHDIHFKRMQDFNFTEEEIEEFYQAGADNSCMKNNPFTLSAGEVKEIYLETLKERW